MRLIIEAILYSSKEPLVTGAPLDHTGGTYPDLVFLVLLDTLSGAYLASVSMGRMRVPAPGRPLGEASPANDQKPRSAKRTKRNGRQALVDAALEIVAEDGVASISLREAARRAGVTHGAPYRHFPDRAALVAAVAEEGFRTLREATLRAVAKAGPSAGARFKALGVAYVIFALENESHFRVMFSAEAARRPEVRAAEGAVFEQCVALVLQTQKAGLVEEGDPRELAFAAWCGVHGLAGLMLDGLAMWLDIRGSHAKVAARVAQILFDGLAGRRSGEADTLTSGREHRRPFRPKP
jgi:AcrR family transcriptional regulator